jgi:hypothetical protein
MVILAQQQPNFRFSTSLLFIVKKKQLNQPQSINHRTVPTVCDGSTSMI